VAGTNEACDGLGDRSRRASGDDFAAGDIAHPLVSALLARTIGAHK